MPSLRKEALNAASTATPPENEVAASETEVQRQPRMRGGAGSKQVAFDGSRFKVVPVEPTEAMVEAGKGARTRLAEGAPPGVALAAIYRAMLAAASPASPQARLLPDAVSEDGPPSDFGRAAVHHSADGAAEAGEPIPAGMTGWDGGDSAPDDWDGGPVWVKPGAWLRNPEDYQCWAQVIAYTAGLMEGRERSDVDCSLAHGECNSCPLQPIAAEAGEPIASHPSVSEVQEERAASPNNEAAPSEIANQRQPSLTDGCENTLVSDAERKVYEVLREALEKVLAEADYSSRDATGFIADRIARIRTIASAALARQGNGS